MFPTVSTAPEAADFTVVSVAAAVEFTTVVASFVTALVVSATVPISPPARFAAPPRAFTPIERASPPTLPATSVVPEMAATPPSRAAPPAWVTESVAAPATAPAAAAPTLAPSTARSAPAQILLSL